MQKTTHSLVEWFFLSYIIFRMNVQKILSNKILLNGLEKISERGVSFSAGISLAMSLGVRPFAISLTPDTEKENKHYAMANSISSGLMKFAIIESAAIPVENAIKRIDKNPEKFLNSNTIKNLPPKAYKLITQVLKLSTGFLTAIPKSMLTVALIPIVMDKVFKFVPAKSKDDKNLSTDSSKNVSFTGLSSKLGKIIDSKKVQNFAIKYQNHDKDIAKHITAATDILLTSTSVYRTNKSEGIDKNRKKALIYNNIISTAITILGGYSADNAIKNKTKCFIDKFAAANAGNTKLPKYIEGINILRPALVFAAIYYGILPIFSTYIAEKIDKHLNNKPN